MNIRTFVVKDISRMFQDLGPQDKSTYWNTRALAASSDTMSVWITSMVSANSPQHGWFHTCFKTHVGQKEANIELTKDEAELLMVQCQKGLLSKTYFMGNGLYDLTINEYQGVNEGVYHATFEDLPANFSPPVWVGKEITDVVNNVEMAMAHRIYRVK